MSFADFWDAYPLKIGKLAASNAWYRATTRASTETILAGAIDYRDWLAERSPTTWRPGACHAATWLNGNRWEDELPRLEPVLRFAHPREQDDNPPIDPREQDRVGAMIRDLAERLRR